MNFTRNFFDFNGNELILNLSNIDYISEYKQGEGDRPIGSLIHFQSGKEVKVTESLDDIDAFFNIAKEV